jgi:hypothetical protein
MKQNLQKNTILSNKESRTLKAALSQEVFHLHSLFLFTKKIVERKKFAISETERLIEELKQTVNLSHLCSFSSPYQS